MMKLGMAAAAAVGAATVFGGGLERISAGKDTTFLLEAKKGAVVDVSGRYAAKDLTASKVEFVKDETFGEVMRFGEEPKAGISVPDGGKISFTDGLTVEAWVYLEKPIEPKRPCGVAAKPNRKWDQQSFCTTLRNKNGNNFVLDFVGVKGEPVEFAEFEGRNKKKAIPDTIWPSLGNTMNGLYNIPTGQWTRIAFTYDRKLGLLRTLVNGGRDRQAFNPTAWLTSELVDDDAAPVKLFDGATNLRVAQVHMASRPVAKCAAPPFEVFVTELSYRGKQYVHVVPTDHSLEFPIEVAIQNVKPPYTTEELTYTLTGMEPRNLDVPKYRFGCVPTDLVVRFKRKGLEFYRYETVILNSQTMAPASGRMLRCQSYRGNTIHPDWWIGEDNTIYYKEKPIFPIMTCFVDTNDFETVTDLGFNSVLMRKPSGMNMRVWEETLALYYRRAGEKGVFIEAVGGDVEDRPGQGFLRTSDEPWGYSFETFRRDYQYWRNVRQRCSTLPIYIAQNNWQRYRETGACCDILAVDPYWSGRSPMRVIHDSVQTAIRETDGLKPVSVSIGNYGTVERRPQLEELRTMSYMGIIGGARSINFYAWNDGPGQNTSDMPEVIADYRVLFGEFKALNDALTVPNAVPGPTFDAKTRGFFACLKKTRADKRKGIASKAYLIVASDLYKPETRTMVCPELAGKTAKALFGSKRGGSSEELAFDASGRAALTMPPLSSAVFAVE